MQQNENFAKQAEQAEGAHVPDEVFAGVFAEWWEEEGQYCRAGGGDYERTFAFQAWRHLYPLLLQARAALAQPSPKCATCNDSGQIVVSGPHYQGEFQPPEYETEPCDMCAQPSPAQAEQAEAERPEVVARVVHSNPVVLGQCGPLNANDELMTVAQHAASVARWAEMFNRVEQQRDAALARVAELTATRNRYGVDAHYFNKNLQRILRDFESFTTDELARSLIILAMVADEKVVAQAQHSVPEGWVQSLPLKDYQPCKPNEDRANGYVIPIYSRPVPVEEALRKLRAVLCDPVGNVVIDGSDGDREEVQRALGMLAAAPTQAQHSVPEKVRTLLSRAQCEIEHLAECLENVCEDEEDFDVREDVADGRVVAADIAHMLAAAPDKEVPQAWLDVQAERRRQVEAEGWTPEHDDEHADGQMAQAAGCYALHAGGIGTDWPDGRQNGSALFWPWDKDSWKPTTPRRDLVKACALALAEIERLDRAGISQSPQPGATTASS
ncbi:hypothetical protein [Pseudomonas aeruginosa]|uniref:hypothetical protein n=1 Tax=Pseudomonas aeruginosa TaxID=287 RepID=UPI001F4B0069|nr:hypothetical protein [Pseudomonas aeruginosa]